MKMIELKEQIAESIEYAKKELGFVLVSEDWGNKDGKCACALGCVLIKNNIPLTGDDQSEQAASLLGVNNDWVGAFISGFDQTPWQLDETSTTPASELIAANKAGIEIRERFSPLRYDVYADSFVEDEDDDRLE